MEKCEEGNRRDIEENSLDKFESNDASEKVTTN